MGIKGSFKSTSSGEPKDPIEAGKYTARIYKLFDLGMHKNTYKDDKLEHKIGIGFAMCDAEGKALIHNEKSAYGSEDIGEQKSLELMINLPRSIKKTGPLISTLRKILDEIIDPEKLQKLEASDEDFEYDDLLVGQSVRVTVENYTNTKGEIKDKIVTDSVRETDVDCECAIAESYVPGLMKFMIDKQEA